MNCLVIDDNALSRTALRQLISQTDFLELKGECADPVEAFNALKKEKIDLLFLDIEMPGMTGLEFVRQLETRPIIILVSAKKDYALEAFELNVADYIMKPVQLPRFMTAVARAKELFDNRESKVEKSEDREYFFVRTHKQLSKIRLDEILYIQALGDYVTIHTFEKKITVHLTLRAIENELPSARFYRLHRSFIAALDHIDSIEENTAYIKGNPVPIGEPYKSTLLKKLHLI
ncbi:MAG TPA: LytTR family DNA-binding domain-containing protein [Bacteroidia bacterium]|nr:LytTR family DNA-binding domain-containing protein [Bacteroidia bacterium]